MILFTEFYIITSYTLKTSMATRQPENAHAGNHPRARPAQNSVTREYAFGAVFAAQAVGNSMQSEITKIESITPQGFN